MPPLCLNPCMANGLHTTVEMLSHKLLQRWVPKWYEAFCDHDLGGFYERLGHSFKPVMTGQRRLITQCRQLSVYSHAVVEGGGRAFGGLDRHFAFMVSRYHDMAGGGWRFSIDDDGKPLDEANDLYALAFVIFACSHYYRATGEEQARVLAGSTLEFIDRQFRVAGMPGLAEAVDKACMPLLDRLRRHESHMHLLEACLFAAETFREPRYNRMADEMIDLFLTYFYDHENNRLSEYFSNDLKEPAPEKGHIILEPGHYAEWIWLLKRYAGHCGAPARYDDMCAAMLEWASTAGWDSEYGGIYDELAPDGTVVADTKRLWPFAEALKANALMLDSGVDKVKLKARINDMVRVFKSHYMQERGFWTEWLNRDLSEATDYMPGTTPYHVYFGIMETRGVIMARGKTRSLTARPVLGLYRLRRALSERVRDARFWLKERRL